MFFRAQKELLSCALVTFQKRTCSNVKLKSHHPSSAVLSCLKKSDGISIHYNWESVLNNMSKPLKSSLHYVSFYNFLLEVRKGLK